LFSQWTFTVGVANFGSSNDPKKIILLPGYFLFVLKIGVPHLQQKFLAARPETCQVDNWSVPWTTVKSSSATITIVEKEAPVIFLQIVQWQLPTSLTVGFISYWTALHWHEPLICLTLFVLLFIYEKATDGLTISRKHSGTATGCAVSASTVTITVLPVAKVCPLVSCSL
jgi:hypothetical protein